MIRGKLMGQKDNPIIYANIIVNNTQLGTISNKDGEFEINIPDNITSPALIISSIGYNTKILNIKSLQTSRLQIIILEKAIVNLNEIIIKVNPTNSNEIVKKAFNNYYQNFPSSPFVSDVFLRYTEKNRNSYKWLIEAAMEIYDPGFHKNPIESKINIKEVRKSLDNRDIDSLDIYRFYLCEEEGLSLKKAQKKATTNIPKDEIQKAILHHDYRKSSPLRLLTTCRNVLRYYNQKNAIFNKNIIKKHKFKIDSVLTYDSDEIYKIKILPHNPPAKLNKTIGNYRYPIGWIYIRAKDYAIIELEYTLVRSDKSKLLNTISGSKISSTFRINFTEINGRMYPKYLSFKKPKFNKLYSIIHNIGNAKKSKEDDFYFSETELLFNHIITDYEYINSIDLNKWEDNVFIPRRYNENFWTNYNVLLQTKDDAQLIIDLENKIKLKKQFKISQVN